MNGCVITANYTLQSPNGQLFKVDGGAYVHDVINGQHYLSMVSIVNSVVAVQIVWNEVNVTINTLVGRTDVRANHYFSVVAYDNTAFNFFLQFVGSSYRKYTVDPAASPASVVFKQDYALYFANAATTTFSLSNFYSNFIVTNTFNTTTPYRTNLLGGTADTRVFTLTTSLVKKRGVVQVGNQGITLLDTKTGDMCFWNGMFGDVLSFNNYLLVYNATNMFIFTVQYPVPDTTYNPTNTVLNPPTSSNPASSGGSNSNTNIIYTGTTGINTNKGTGSGHNGSSKLSFIALLVVVLLFIIQ